MWPGEFRCGLVMFGRARQARHGVARHAGAGRGFARCGWAWTGMAGKT